MNMDVMGVREVSPGYEFVAENPAVPVGYKQTEVGVIPEDWDLQRLGELAKFRTGPFGSSLHKSDYVTGGIPVINPMHIVDGQLFPSSNMSVREETAGRLSEFRLQEGDIVLGRRGDMGRCAVVRKQHSGWLCGTGSMIVRPGSEADPHFLQRILSSQEIIALIENSSVGSTMINLNQSTLIGLPVKLPSKSEQLAIATALSDVDALLEELDRLIAKKRDIKQAAMQQLLTGETRLPGFEGEWETRTLSSISDIRSGGTPSTSDSRLWNGGIPWCTPTDITSLKRKYLFKTERTISQQGLKSSSAELIPPGSTIMTSRATIGECAINRVPMATNQGFKNLVPTEVDSEFLYYIMITQKDRLISLCTGSTFLEIGKKQLDGYELFIPSSVEEQAAISSIISDIDTEIHALEQRRSKTAELKQGMMQELLTGRTRLV